MMFNHELKKRILDLEWQMRMLMNERQELRCKSGIHTDMDWEAVLLTTKPFIHCKHCYKLPENLKEKPND